MNWRHLTIETMCTTTERQQFDRKSAKIDATAISTPMIAFANADGGLIAVGIEDDGTITGIDNYTKKVNEILRAPFDFCRPFMLLVTIKNKKMDNTTQVATQVATQVVVQNKILEYCAQPRKKSEIAEYCGFKGIKNFTKNYLKPLLDSGKITMTIPDKPKSQNQKYITVFDRESQK